MSPELDLAADALDRSFKAGSYEVSLGGARRELATCRALVAVLPEPELEVEGTQNDYSAFWAEAVRCAALAFMERARPARSSMIRPLLERDPRDWLPPELSLLDDRRELARVRAAGERCERWTALEPNVVTRSASDERATLANGVWTAELTYYVLADFTQDGFEDLLVRRDATVDDGSYADASLLLLTRTPRDGCVRVVERVH